MKYGVILSRNFTVEADNEKEALKKISNQDEVYPLMDNKDGIKLDTYTTTVYKLDDAFMYEDESHKEDIVDYFRKLVSSPKRKNLRSCIIKTCAKFNLYFSDQLLDSTIKYHDANDYTSTLILKLYLRNLNLIQFKGLDFEDSNFNEAKVLW